MCRAFSCLVMKNATVVWKPGVDAHDKLFSIGRDNGLNLIDDGVRLSNFVRVEVTPLKSYLYPDDGWELSVDERTTPCWFADDHYNAAWAAFEKWKELIYSKINLVEARNPVYPFHIDPPAIDKRVLSLLREWSSVSDSVMNSMEDSVWDSVSDIVMNSVMNRVRDSLRYSVWDSVSDRVRDRVRDSLRNSVWGSVWDRVSDSMMNSVMNRVRNSVWGSVKDNVWAYIGSLLGMWEGKYPYQCGADLWRMGLVPSYDGETWRLHGGLDGRILWEGRL